MITSICWVNVKMGKEGRGGEGEGRSFPGQQAVGYADPSLGEGSLCRPCRDTPERGLRGRDREGKDAGRDGSGRRQTQAPAPTGADRQDAQNRKRADPKAAKS